MRDAAGRRGLASLRRGTKPGRRAVRDDRGAARRHRPEAIAGLGPAAASPGTVPGGGREQRGDRGRLAARRSAARRAAAAARGEPRRPARRHPGASCRRSARHEAGSSSSARSRVAAPCRSSARTRSRSSRSRRWPTRSGSSWRRTGSRSPWSSRGRSRRRIWTKPQPLADAVSDRYRPRVERFRQVAAARSAKAAPVDLVADAVEHALTAGRPKTRYLVGRDARIRAAIERLPDRLARPRAPTRVARRLRPS